MATKIYIDWCPELIVRTDFGHSTHPDHKNIAMMSCKAEAEGRKCRRKGSCTVARSNETAERVTSKTFGA